MFTRKIKLSWLPRLALGCLLGLIACAPQPDLSSGAMAPPQAALSQALSADEPGVYLNQVSYRPAEAQYFDLIRQTLALNSAEQVLLAQNGFVVSDRLAFDDFTTAYAEIYRQDLPVLITTDSILQAVHHLYDDLLLKLEEALFSPKLNDLLKQARQQVQAEARANTEPELASLYADLDLYLAVPLALLAEVPDNSPAVAHYVGLVQAASGVTEVDLFGQRRPLDFSLFKARGHYTKSDSLERYFRAMSWLALVDFRLVEFDPQGKPQLQLEQVAAAALLNQALDKAGQRSAWAEFESLFIAFVGRSDNMTLTDLDHFLAEAGLKSPLDLIHHPAPQQLLARLSSGAYGRQRITGQILGADPAAPLTVPPPVSFMLLGQRFSLDSYLMNNLVYDRLVVDGRKVNRRLPSPLDVMVALGNDRAATHLQSEFTKYGYQDNLAALRQEVEGYEPAFWTSSAYNRWLGALRELDGDTTGRLYPQAMRTSAWADKMLHTQLASWAQLRHDNILYVKQAVTGNLCEYPAGYVEPYPRFYAAVHAYAQAQQSLLAKLDPAHLTPGAEAVRQTALTQFGRLAAATARLQSMAEKELRLEPFSPAEEKFLKETAVRKIGALYESQWAGWYPELFLEYNRAAYEIDQKDKSPAMIVDIHTDPGRGPTQPASVLHVAAGPVAALIFIADTDEGPTMYVGPAFTYYEVIETGWPPQRLTDQEWQKRFSPLAEETRPAAPAWSGSFRLPPESAPPNLWWWRGSVMGLVTLGVYMAGIYSRRRWLLWLSSGAGVGLGLWLLALASMALLNMTEIMISEQFGGMSGPTLGGHGSGAYLSYSQQMAPLTLFGLMFLVVGLLSLAKKPGRAESRVYRSMKRAGIGAIISLIILTLVFGLSGGAGVMVGSVILTFGLGLLLWLPLWYGIGYLTHFVMAHILRLGSLRHLS
jgi:hypothetical protein